MSRDHASSAAPERVNPKDLEVIVTCLETAGLILTEAPGQTFTKEQLYREARELVGEEIQFDERDLDIVLSTSRSFKPAGGGLFRLR